MARRPIKRNVKVLRAVRPNAGLTAEYRRRILKLVDQMQASVKYWLSSAYRQNEPAIISSTSNEDEKIIMALDESEVMLNKSVLKSGNNKMQPGPYGGRVLALDAVPATELQRAIRKMVRQWQKRFNVGADELANFFAKAARSRSDRQLQAILKRAGFSVKFTTTPAMRDVMRATVEANVQLIKSIPQQYLTQVQGAVMRSVQTGRDLSSLTSELQEQFGVTRRKASFNALQQNNAATSAMQKVRQVELGIKRGVWMHSHAGKEPRPTHLANDGKVFDIAKGWFDPDPKVRRRIMPGELIRCRCTWKPIVPGFS